MKYTIEDVKRLVPEATLIEEVSIGRVSICIGNTGLWSHSEPGKLLLDTRRQLEIAREGLERLSGDGKQFPDTTANERLARETLAAIEGVTK